MSEDSITLHSFIETEKILDDVSVSVLKSDSRSGSNSKNTVTSLRDILSDFVDFSRLLTVLLDKLTPMFFFYALETAILLLSFHLSDFTMQSAFDFSFHYCLIYFLTFLVINGFTVNFRLRASFFYKNNSSKFFEQYSIALILCYSVLIATFTVWFTIFYFLKAKFLYDVTQSMAPYYTVAGSAFALPFIILTLDVLSIRKNTDIVKYFLLIKVIFSCFFIYMLVYQGKFGLIGIAMTILIIKFFEFIVSFVYMLSDEEEVVQNLSITVVDAASVGDYFLRSLVYLFLGTLTLFTNISLLFSSHDMNHNEKIMTIFCSILFLSGFAVNNSLCNYILSATFRRISQGLVNIAIRGMIAAIVILLMFAVIFYTIILLCSPFIFTIFKSTEQLNLSSNFVNLLYAFFLPFLLQNALIAMLNGLLKELTGATVFFLINLVLKSILFYSFQLLSWPSNVRLVVASIIGLVLDVAIFWTLLSTFDYTQIKLSCMAELMRERKDEDEDGQKDQK